MAVKEIASLSDAEERLIEYFGDVPDRQDYAGLAFFLSDRERVAAALEKVSAGIWEEYRQPRYEGTINRFTRAIIRYATGFGFACQDNVVFTGPLTSEDFLDLVKRGVLWKDTFAPEHGEFSHSFQWLAAGLALGWDSKTATLFKGSDVDSVADMYGRDETGISFGKQKLWAWLVDCFPARTTDPKIDDRKDNIDSDTCRVPNNITALVAGKDDWFISMYVSYRNKVKLGKAIDEGKKDEVYEKRYSKPEKLKQRSGFQAIQSYQTAHYESGRGEMWEGKGPLTEVATPSGAEKNVHRVFQRSTELQRPAFKPSSTVTFHGAEGEVADHLLKFTMAK